ncbi:MAG: cytochrome d ubiquinol oxidase subunit II [Dehalococcoidia bacterium]|nr:cytochrome d ubiquinol oxidase subunit II [Dehalococcoidia bacterium]
MNLQIIWFILIAVLFIGFFFLEGFDFGVGIATRLITKDRSERNQLIGTIAPFWDGNEVWLLSAGGAIFAAFPHWYATMFSGYYIPLTIVLLALILRGVSFEFRMKMHSERARNLWDWFLFIGSLLPPFLLGVLFTSLVKGMPIDENMTMYAGFWDYISLYSVVGGVAVTLLCLLHGLNFISLRTNGIVRTRASELSNKLYYLLYAGLAIFVLLTIFNTDFYKDKTALMILLSVAIVIISTITHSCVIRRKEAFAFLFSGLSLCMVVVLLFSGLFPRVTVSSIDPSYSMDIYMASSSPYTLKLMTIVAFCILPFVLAYQGWSYYIFRKRVSKADRINNQ